LIERSARSRDLYLTTHTLAYDGIGTLNATKRAAQIYSLDPADTAIAFHFNIILQRTPGLTSVLLPSRVPTKPLQARLLSAIHVICPAHLILPIINIKNEIITLSDVHD
jgi:hypothetical protein